MRRVQRTLFSAAGALALTAGAAAQGAAQSATADILCNGIEVGEIRLTVEPYNFTHGPAGAVKRSVGANAVGGFQLSNAAARDANCWCDSYRWFQAIDVTANGINLGGAAPTFGQTAVTDPFPTTQVQWGGGVTTGDFYPFYWGNPAGKCGHNAAAGRNPIPGMPGKSWDLYYEDGPGLTFNEASPPAPFTLTLDFVTCLACVGDPLAGNGRNKSGSFKLLACIRWSVTMRRTAAGAWSSVIGAPVAVAPGAVPAFVATSLANFNARPGVGTWTLTNTCQPCPPPAIPPIGPPRLQDPGIVLPVAPMFFDPATETLELPVLPPLFFDDMGFNAPAPQYQSDPALGGLFGSLSYHLVGQLGPNFLFINDTQFVNFFLDDPFDQPDRSLFMDPTFPGNPGGWETFITGEAPILIYDPLQQLLLVPLLDPLLDPLGSPFLDDLANAMAPPLAGLTLHMQALTDPLQATQNFTQPGQFQVQPFLLPTDPLPMGQPYCPVQPNSTGQGTQLFATGSPFVQDNLMFLHTTGMPPFAAGFVLASDGQLFLPAPGGSQGNLCVGPDIGRGVGDEIFNSGPFGSATVRANLDGMPTPTGFVPVSPGQTWYFQTWHRDLLPIGTTSNLSNGLQLMFQ